MKRVTFDLVLAAVLAIAPLASAQEGLDVPGAIKNRNDTSPAGPHPAPPGTRRNTPPFPGDEPLPPQRVPPDVPPAGLPAPSSTTGSERSGNEPIDTTPPAAARPEAPDGDLRLVERIHQLNEKEMKIAQLASDKARSPRVKSYARTLVSHHKAADRQLMSYASKRGLVGRMEATTGKPADAASGDMHARLLGETGAEFDHDFVATMVDDHDRAIEAVRAARDAAVDPQLRDLFHGLLPKLEKHRKMAQQLLDKHVKS